MNNQVEKFDPSKLMDGVKDRIKATFVSLIPDQAWDEMVVKVKDDFFKSVPNDNWGRNGKPSEFEIIVKNELEKELRKKVSEFFESSEWKSTWNNSGKLILAAEVKKILVENAGQIFMNMIQGPLVSVINNMGQNANNLYYR